MQKIAKRRKRGHGWTKSKKKSKESLFEIDVLKKIKEADGKSLVLVNWKKTNTNSWIPEENLQDYRSNRDKPIEMCWNRVYRELKKLSQQFDITPSVVAIQASRGCIAPSQTEFEVNLPIKNGLWSGFIVPVTFSMGSYPFEPPQVGCGKSVYHPNFDSKHGYWELPTLALRTWTAISSIEEIIQDLLRVFHHPDMSHSPNPELLAIRELYQHNRPQFEVNVERSLNQGEVNGTIFPRLKICGN